MMEELNASSSPSRNSVAHFFFCDVGIAVTSIAQVYVFTRKCRKRKMSDEIEDLRGGDNDEEGPEK